MGSPFTEEEKRFLLAEMIKVSKVDVHALVEFVKTNRVEQRWYSIQVPTGRNLEQCFQAAESMFGTPISPPSLTRETPSTKQMLPSSSATALAPPPLSTAPQLPEGLPTDSSLPPISVAPGVAVQSHRSSTPQHVPIQPRPPPINGVTNLPPSVSAEPPAKRRRGRPPRPKTLHNRSGPGGTKSLPPLAPLPPTSTAPQHVSTPIAPLAESSSQRTLSPAYSVSTGASFESLSVSRGQKRGPPVKDDEQQHVCAHPRFIPPLGDAAPLTALPKSTSETAMSTLSTQSMSSTPRPDTTPGPRHQWPLQPDEDRSNRLETPTRQATPPPPPSTTQSQQGPSPLSAAKATPVRT